MKRFYLPWLVMPGLFSPFTLASELSERGEHLFRTAGGYGCSTCHGLYAQGGGNVGGNIRGKGLESLNAILEKEPTMQLLGPTLSAEDRQAISVYLESLGKLNLVEWTVEEPGGSTSINLKANQTSQLVILNKKFESVELMLPSSISAAPVVINPYETVAFIWTPDGESLALKHKDNELHIHIMNK